MDQLAMIPRSQRKLESRDLDTVARAQKGDVDAVGRLYDAHQDAVYRYLWARLGDRGLAEDLTGDVFMRMLAALPGYRLTEAPFRAWLYRIARNRLVDYYRQAGARPAVPLHAAEAQPAAGDDPSDLAQQRLDLERVHAALARLEETQREVVTLRFLSGLSLQETAAALEKTEAAIKAVQHRGLAALRAALAEGQVNHAEPE